MSVRSALLGLVAQRPRHAYELYMAFLALAGGEQSWEVKPAQVYTTLNRLEEAGLLAANLENSAPENGENGKKVFRITPAGRQELCDWLIQPVPSQRQRDEVFLKLLISLATGEVDPPRVIQAQRASLYRELHDLTRQRSNADPRRELARILLFDQAIMHVEADLRWLDMVEVRLEEIRRQPLPEPDLRPRGRPPRDRQP